MADVRPMAGTDVEAAVDVWVAAHSEMRARVGRPVPAPSAADLERQRSRMHHLRDGDPDGSWVAVDGGGRVVGLSQSFVREGYWVLSLLGVDPATQGAGVGRRLLEAALSHGTGLPGTIQASRDPAAVRLYQRAGFDLHPSVGGWGRVRPGSLTPDPRVRHGGAGDIATAVAIDRAVRGSARPGDLAYLLRQPGNRLLLLDDRAYAVAADDRVVTVGATDAEAASAVLTTALADAAVPFEMGWITAPQQWAVATALQAGLELHPTGPVMVRGMPAPPSPCLPSGGFG